MKKVMIDSLSADAFLVLSRGWEVDGHDDCWSDADRARVARTSANREMLDAAVDTLNPVSALILENSSAEAEAVEVRTRHDLPCLHNSASAESSGCGPAPLSSARWLSCYGMIVAAERRRNAPYEMILRTRPDVYLQAPLVPPHPDHVSDQMEHLGSDGFAAYSFDHYVLMSRNVANVSLHEAVLGAWEGTNRPLVPFCGLDATMCNPCLVHRAGFLVMDYAHDSTTVVRYCKPGVAELEPSPCMDGFHLSCDEPGSELDPEIPHSDFNASEQDFRNLHPQACDVDDAITAKRAYVCDKLVRGKNYGCSSSA